MYESRTAAPVLSCAIVTYQTRDMLRDCILSVKEDCGRSGIPCRIVVVDNASTDGTMEMLRTEFPDVVAIGNSENLGFSKALNQSIRAGMDSKYVLMLNSDIKVLQGAVGTMFRYLEAHPDVSGVIGPLLNADLTRQKQRTTIVRILPKRKDESRPFQVTFSGNTFHMVRSDALRDVGLFDESYFFFNEDLDWSLRAVRRGHKFMFLPEARVIHYGGGGRKNALSAIKRDVYKSNMHFYLKNYGGFVAALAFMAMLLEVRGRIGKVERELSRLGKSTPREEGEILRLKEDHAILEEARARLVAEYRRGRTGR